VVDSAAPRDDNLPIVFADVRASMLRCMRCPALVRCRSRVVPGAGDVPAEVVFVGVAPGRFGGDRTGIPFSGDRSGDLLRRMIRRAGLASVFITNLVRCNPRDEAGRNRDPKPIEIASCREYLEAELALARPRVVACLGRIAWRELAGRNARFNPRRPMLINSNGFGLYPMYHPAYVNRGAYSRRAYAAQFAKLARILRSSAKLADPQQAIGEPCIASERVCESRSESRLREPRLGQMID
jgi:uracil-DNA glycosylase